MTDDFAHQYTQEITEPFTEGSGVTIDDFRAYMPSHSYIFTPCREIWAGPSVNARIPPIAVLDKHGQPTLDKNGKVITIKATMWLDQNRPVEQMTWCPGLTMLIPDRLVIDGGWIERKGVTCFNLYRPPRLELGDASKGTPWLEHLAEVFPDDHNHIIKWLAHRVQCPQDKINHALVLGGAQGIGKDSLLEPVKYAIGPWNFHEVSPTQMLGRFNSFVKSVILRVSEARDLGEIDRFKFYDHTKIYTACPPDVLRTDEKHLREHYVFNALGFLITTNHKTDGIYLPADDRRHYVAWSNRSKEEFSAGYWNALWNWYMNEGGIGHVAAYLSEFDLLDFDAKAPPPKTTAFWDIVNASQAPEDAELADVIDALGAPCCVTLPDLITKASGETLQWLMERKNRRSLPHRMERAGYAPVRNPERNDGLWIAAGVRQVIYAKAKLSPSDQQREAQKLVRQSKQ
jgi:hypothetical protein